MTDLTQYALAQAFRIVNHERNLYTTKCYGCDARIPPDHGHQVMQLSMYGARHHQRYLCQQCFTPIREAHEAMYREFGKGIPHLWAELTRPPMERPHAKRSQPPRPGPREIDALIADREAQIHGDGSTTPQRRNKVDPPRA